MISEISHFLRQIKVPESFYRQAILSITRHKFSEVVFKYPHEILNSRKNYRTGAKAGKERVSIPQIKLIIKSSDVTIDDLRRCACTKLTEMKRRHQSLGFSEYTFTETSVDEMVRILTADCAMCGRDINGGSTHYHSIRLLSLPVTIARSFPIQTVDRISSSKGYIDGNLQPLCATCNFMKNNWNMDFVTVHTATSGVALLKKKLEDKSEYELTDRDKRCMFHLDFIENYLKEDEDCQMIYKTQNEAAKRNVRFYFD